MLNSRSKCILYKNRSHLDYIKALDKIFKIKKNFKSSSKNALKYRSSSKQQLIELFQRFIEELIALCYEQYDFINYIKDLISKLENIENQEEQMQLLLNTNYDFYKKLFDLVEVECDLYLNKPVLTNNVEQQNKNTSQFNSPNIANQKLKKPNTFENNEDLIKIISILEIKNFYHNNPPKCIYIDESGILIDKLKNDMEKIQEETNMNLNSSQLKSSNLRVSKTIESVETDELFVKYDFKLYDYCIII